MHFCPTFTFSSHLIPTNSNIEIILLLCLTFTFPIIHPTQSHQEKEKIFTITFLLFGTEVLICQTNLRVVGRGLGWQTVGLIPPMFNLNDHPTQIPPSEILGPVVQNCRQTYEIRSAHCSNIISKDVKTNKNLCKVL